MSKILKVNQSDFKKLFGADGAYSALDFVTFVRSKIKDPWEPVVLDADFEPPTVEALEPFLIFWKGYNETKIDHSIGISVKAYCVLGYEDIKWDSSDFGLDETLNQFQLSYNVQNVIALIAVEDDSVQRSLFSVSGSIADVDNTTERISNLLSLRDYAIERGIENIIFPNHITRRGKLLKNGVDISEYATQIELRRQRNSLDHKYLAQVIEEIQGRITDKTVIQDLSEHRTRDLKVLSTYLALKYKVPPIYVGSFISEYLEYEFVYPSERLSFLERLTFLSKMPKSIGYITGQENYCYPAVVMNKIWSHPSYVFDLDKKEVIPESEYYKFQIGTPGLKFIDFRTMFPGSKKFYEDDNAAIAISGKDDASVDDSLAQLFAYFGNLVTDEDIYPSVKNCVLVLSEGRKYILYCPEELGLDIILMSEYFGRHRMVLTESKFKYLIDVQLVKALLYRERAESIREGTAGLALSWRQFSDKVALEPAIPYDITLHNQILSPLYNGLSYYDKFLRSATNILPVITSLDSSLRRISPLFKYLNIRSLRKDPQAMKAISCFGTLRDLSEKHSIPITYLGLQGKEFL